LGGQIERGEQLQGSELANRRLIEFLGFQILLEDYPLTSVSSFKEIIALKIKAGSMSEP
jgi:hypothetical protein